MFQTIPGYFAHPREQAELAALVSQYDHKDCIGVEIGSMFGSSASLIAQNIPNGTLYCIDPWSGISHYNPNYSDEVIEKYNLPKPGMYSTLEFFKDNTKSYTNIISIQGKSPKCVFDWHQPVDFVFLDASHENPSDADNIKFWLPKIKSGGKFIGHDYDKRYPDVKKNVHNLCIKLKRPPKIVHTLWSFTIP